MNFISAHQSLEYNLIEIDHHRLIVMLSLWILKTSASMGSLSL